jgi:hypothetical protein
VNDAVGALKVGLFYEARLERYFDAVATHDDTGNRQAAKDPFLLSAFSIRKARRVSNAWRLA